MGQSQQTAVDELKRKKKYLNAMRARARELDKILSKCYEDNINGKLSDKRFARLDRQYTLEQKEFAEKVKALQSELENRPTRL